MEYVGETQVRIRLLYLSPLDKIFAFMDCKQVDFKGSLHKTCKSTDFF